MILTSNGIGQSEVVVIVKAAPQIGTKSGETVCCAGIDLSGSWIRLFPVSFRQLNADRKFKRWDRIQFSWRKPKDDKRYESRRVEHETIEIIGSLPKNRRTELLSRLSVTSLDKEFREGRSLALLKPEIIEFFPVKKTIADIKEEVVRFEQARNQKDLFATNTIQRYRACPYIFKYRYRTDDGTREGTCQDWEIPTTYLKWSKLYGEAAALDKMLAKFGQEYPNKGIAFAMGTHSRYPEIWLINGVIRLEPEVQLSLL